MTAAGFWRRYAAWSLDAAMIGVPVALIAWLGNPSGLVDIGDRFDAVAARFAALALEGLRSADHPLLLAQAWLADDALHRAMAGLQSAIVDTLSPGFTAFVVLAAIYWVAFECSPWQATPGKRALDLAVTDLRGQRLGLLRAGVRHVAGSLSWLTLNLGHALAALPPHKRALHDYIAGTRVAQHQPRPLPAWGCVWLLLQAVGAVAATVWLMLRIQGALQRALYQLL